MNDKNKAADRFALAAMIFGISGLLLSCIVLGGVMGIIGLVVSILAWRNPDCMKKGFALTGIITSAVAIVISAFVIFVFVGSYSYFDDNSIVQESTEITYLDVTEIP